MNRAIVNGSDFLHDDKYIDVQTGERFCIKKIHNFFIVFSKQDPSSILFLQSKGATMFHPVTLAFHFFNENGQHFQSIRFVTIKINF